MKLEAHISRKEGFVSSLYIYDRDLDIILSVQGGLLYIGREEKQKKVSAFVCLIERMQKIGIEVSGLEEILAEFYKPPADSRTS